MSKEDFLEDSTPVRKRPTPDQNIQLVNNYYNINPEMSPEEVYNIAIRYRQYMNSYKNDQQQKEEAKRRNARLLEQGINPQDCVLYEIVQPAGVNRENPTAPFTDQDMEKWIKKVPEGVELFVFHGEITAQPPEMMGKFYNSQSFWEIYMLKPQTFNAPTPHSS
jgi:hypothetical protein